MTVTTASISLQKRADKVGILLQKKGINSAPTMRVGNALDISASMDHIILNDSLQKSFDQTMAVAVKFDDNGELDVFKFDTRCEFVDTANDRNYSDFIQSKKIKPRGGTAYAPIIEEAINFYFKPKKKFFGLGGSAPANNMPVLFMLHTDGEPGDRRATERALVEAQKYPIYFHFVGVGGSRAQFPTIASLADDLPNVGEVYLPRFDLDDDAVYEQLICDELIEWIGKFSTASSASA